MFAQCKISVWCISKLFIPAILFSSIIQAQGKEIVAYFPGFSSSRHAYYVKNIEKTGSAGKITILNYAFAVPDPDSSGNIIPKINAYAAYQEIYSAEMSIDGIADDPTQSLRGNFNQLRKLKKKHPGLKILLSIGGWGGSKYFSDLALTHESREIFVNACIDLFIKGNLPIENNAGGEGCAEGIFNGFDLDWEFPISGGPEGTHYSPNDRENHTALFAIFRERLNSIDKNLLLTAAVSARSWEFWKYNFNRDQQYLDFFNVMTYDYHGIWDSITGHHTNLLSSPNDPDVGEESLDRTIRYLLDSAGVKNDKIVPGAAFYGKGWIDADSINHGLYQSAKTDTARTRIRFKNYTDFSDIANEGYRHYWDDYSMAAWLYNQNNKKFWTYDDIRSVALKARYVYAYNLRGLMFWAINGDDTLGTLVSTIYNRNMPDITTYTIRSNNELPLIAVTEPDNNSVNYTKNSNVIIKTNTHDKDGDIVKVEFFIDDNSIGYNTIPPFNWAWFNTSSGKYKIKAVATDNNGGRTSSVPVGIKIR